MSTPPYLGMRTPPVPPFVLACLLFVASACDKVLTTAPESFVGTTNFYQTPDQIDRAVIGAYSSLQTIYGAGGTAPMWTMAEMRSDNTTYMYNNSNRGSLTVETVDEFLTTPDNVPVLNMWTLSYQTILQANTVLDRIGAVRYTNAMARSRAVGEMKFLRALSYFNLVRSFGAVPLKLHEVSTYDGAFARERTPVDAVYAQIVSDLTDAIPTLPTRAALSAAERGRATQGAATMLLADVYMTRQQYAEAITALQAVLGMGYSLVTPYGRVFDPTFKNGPESIFEVQYAESVIGQSSSFLFRFIPFNSGKDLVFVSTDDGQGGGWNVPTRDMVRTYEPGDLRLESSIGFYVKTGNAQYTDVALGDSIPYVKKYYHPYTTAGRTNDDFPVYRFAEAKLLLAEALNETGQTALAYSHVNDIRARAGLAPLSAGLTQDQFRDAVIHEERVELAFEDKRWFQLLRTGRAIAVMTAHGADIKSYTTFRAAASYNITQNSLLYPIPIRELTVNGFAQNPGY
ncbi:MAG: RagB/SusD family nutrient uptake outer membrane protein [Gemmatimonadaceae bacterium]